MQIILLLFYVMAAQVAQGSVLAAGQIYGVGTLTPSILIWLGFLLYSPILCCFFYLGSLMSTSAGKEGVGCSEAQV